MSYAHIFCGWSKKLKLNEGKGRRGPNPQQTSVEKAFGVSQVEADACSSSTRR